MMSVEELLKANGWISWREAQLMASLGAEVEWAWYGIDRGDFRDRWRPVNLDWSNAEWAYGTEKPDDQGEITVFRLKPSDD